jgi:hypothetical protein
MAGSQTGFADACRVRGHSPGGAAGCDASMVSFTVR